jgi:hypothetical protein
MDAVLQITIEDDAVILLSKMLELFVLDMASRAKSKSQEQYRSTIEVIKHFFKSIFVFLKQVYNMCRKPIFR